MTKKHKDKVDIDPYEPIQRDPEPSRRNPKGVRHLDKTVQDRMRREDRPRVKEAEARRKRMTSGR